MSIASEHALVFPCQSEQLVGIVHRPVNAMDYGVLIVVGGPQYRAGSHRQFVLLARFLAAQGIPVMRFDYRGMGDSSGAARSFDDIDADISAAMDTFFREVPALKKVALWGLCDAASAALFYAPGDSRVFALLLLNPWIRTETGQAKAILKHYYLSRFVTKAFWLKLLTGKLNLAHSLRSISALSKTANNKTDETGCGVAPLPQRMLEGMKDFKGRCLVILSGNDLTAAEFRDLVNNSLEWQRVIDAKSVEVREYAEADHTFSRQQWRRQVEAWTLEWLKSL